MKTKRGIERNLKESDYNSSYGKLKFYFSSLFHKIKFDENIDEYIRKNTIYIYKKYKLPIEIDYFLTISLYKQIENRGFRVVSEETGEISVYNTYEMRV